MSKCHCVFKTGKQFEKLLSSQGGVINSIPMSVPQIYFCQAGGSDNAFLHVKASKKQNIFGTLIHPNILGFPISSFFLG